MTNFKNAEIGKLEEVGKNYENGKAFLHDLLDLTSCEISVSSMPKGIKLPFNHKHKQNEEIYIFLKGEGTMTLDNETIEPVKELKKEQPKNESEDSEDSEEPEAGDDSESQESLLEEPEGL